MANARKEEIVGLKIKDILKVASGLIPGGSIVKSILKGAGSLVFKKAAKKVGIPEKTIDAIFSEGEKIAENDPEVRKALADEDEKRREFEVAFFGNAADLNPKAQLIRAMTRPGISWASVGTFLLLHVARFTLLTCGVKSTPEIPKELTHIVLAIIGFWFSWRGVEKVAGMISAYKTKRNGG